LIVADNENAIFDFEVLLKV